MKFAMIVDGCAQQSYFVNNKGSYKLFADNLEPYIHYHSISNKCHLGIWGWPFVFSDGYFINWAECDSLPNLDLDIVMVAIERDLTRYRVSALRKAYPNAIIVSFVKEASWTNYSWEQRAEFFKECDYITFPWDDCDAIEQLSILVGREVHYIPQPHNIDYLYDSFYNEVRDLSILSYKAPNRGMHSNIVYELANACNTRVVTHAVKYQGPDFNQWERFISGITECSFCFNLDPSKYGGSMGVQCAALGIVNFGGIQDSHKILWPDLATNDEHVLSEKFMQIFNDRQLHASYVQNAYNTAQHVYGYSAVATKFLSMIQN